MGSRNRFTGAGITGAGIAFLLIPLGLAACGGDPDPEEPVAAPPAAAAPAEPAATGPVTDARGVITYPEGYSVVIARANDTLDSIAARLGIPVAELASYNGLPVTWRPRENDTLVVPPGVAPAQVAATPEPPAVPGEPGWSPEIVAEAIDRTGPAPLPAAPGPAAVSPLSEATPPSSPAAPPAVEPPAAQTLPPAPAPGTEVTLAVPDEPAAPPVASERTGAEPVRHIVLPGETIYTIGRLYDVPVSALAAWNGLGRDYTLRPGQVILVPLANVAPPGTSAPVALPPSAADPLPPAPPLAEVPASPNLAQFRSDAPPGTKLQPPVDGPVARPFVKSGPGRNDGVDYAVPAGTRVVAAEAGDVVYARKSLDGHTMIVLIRHAGGLTTIYGRIDEVTVRRGDQVTRGQPIGEVAENPTPSLHFEVRRGAESLDPVPFF
jgi:murein DD-endopeptidase MepM/ murein hydrolase activator NlpD